MAAVTFPAPGTPRREKLENRFWSKVNKRQDHECWEWQAHIAWNGYGVFFMPPKGNHRAHRVAMALHLNKPLVSDDWVLHKCDNRKCCNPTHLYIGDRSDNMRDAVSRNRWVSPAIGNSWTKGALNGQAKLSEDTVRAIRKDLELGASHSKLAHKYSVSSATISMIRNRKRWGHVV